jgi:CheY-like chemotaxis protein
LATILLVDDEPDLVATCQRLLGRLGHVSLSASSAAEAIDLIDREAPDLVVTDLRLPGPDGLAVARHARDRLPRIPVIVISADDSAGTREAVRATGVGAFLAKPFANARFLETVRLALGARALGADGGAAP